MLFDCFVCVCEWLFLHTKLSYFEIIINECLVCGKKHQMLVLGNLRLVFRVKSGKFLFYENFCRRTCTKYLMVSLTNSTSAVEMRRRQRGNVYDSNRIHPVRTLTPLGCMILDLISMRPYRSKTITIISYVGFSPDVCHIYYRV